MRIIFIYTLLFLFTYSFAQNGETTSKPVLASYSAKTQTNSQNYTNPELKPFSFFRESNADSLQKEKIVTPKLSPFSAD